MDIVLLTAGKGKRFPEITCNKSLVPLPDGTTPLYHTLSLISKLYYDNLYIVVGYDSESVISFVKSQNMSNVEFIYQENLTGVVNALELVSNKILDSFYFMCGDEFYFRPRIRHMCNTYTKYTPLAVCGLNYVEDKNDVSKTYTVDLECNVIKRIIEKPDRAYLDPIFNNWQGAGHVLFSKKIFDFLPLANINNIKDFPSLIQLAIDAHQKVIGVRYCDNFVNINTKKDLNYLWSEYVRRFQFVKEKSIIGWKY